MADTSLDALNAGRPFFWQDKERLRVVIDQVPRRKRATVAWTYQVLTLLANDAGKRKFTVYRSELARLTGLSAHSVTNALDELRALSLIATSNQERSQTGQFTPLLIEITKGVYRPNRVYGSTPNREHGADSLPDAIPENEMASTSDADRVHGTTSNLPIVTKELKNKELKNHLSVATSGTDDEGFVSEPTQLNRDDYRPHGMSDDLWTWVLKLTPVVSSPSALVTYLTSSVVLLDLVTAYGQQAVLTALQKTHAKGGIRNPFAYAKSILQQAPPPGSAAPLPTRHSEQDWLNANHVYRSLVAFSTPDARRREMEYWLKQFPGLQLDLDSISSEDFIIACYEYQKSQSTSPLPA